jgi:hypothetical protein
VSLSVREESPTAHPEEDAHRETDEEVCDSLEQPSLTARHLRSSERHAKEHEGRGDAVVEATLHVQQAAHPGGDLGVRHHGVPERGIRGSQCGADDEGDAQRDAWEQQEGRQAPSAMVNIRPMASSRTTGWRPRAAPRP